MWHMISNLIKRCKITGAQNERNFLTAQTSQMGFSGTSEIVYPYGMKAYAPVGSPGITFSIQANEDNRATTPYAFNARSKLPKLSAAGDVVLGSPEGGAYILFKRDGTIELKGKIVFLDAATLNSTLEVKANTTLQNVNAQDATLNSASIGGSNYSTHIHGGVTPGDGTTGPVV